MSGSSNSKSVKTTCPAEYPPVDSLPWYLVRTKPRQEQAAKFQLQRQQYQVYLPLYKQWVKKLGHWLGEETPWFSGYLFVRQADAEQSITPVRSTYGVLTLVSFGPQPEPVDNDLINQLQRLEQQQHRKHDNVTLLPFKTGDQVTIDQGPFRGQQGIVSCCGRERAAVLLNMLGQTVRTTVDIRALVAV